MDTEVSPVKRIPPHSADAERSVIGSMLLSSEAIAAAEEMLTPESFYARQYGIFFRAITELYNSGKPVDSVTILEKLKEMQAPPEIMNAGFIAGLVESVPMSANIRSYASIVRDNAIKRNLIRVNEEIAIECYQGSESTEDILAHAEKKIFDVIQSQGSGENLTPIGRIVLNVLDNIQRVQKSGNAITGVETGFRELDKKTAGFQKSDLILIAARPSMGKTALALNIAEYAAFRKDKTVMIFSLEMSKEQLVNRLIAMESYVDASKIRVGNIAEKEWEKVMTGASIIGRSKLVIDDTPSISVAEMRTKCRRQKLEGGLDMILVDYLQLMTSSNVGKDAGRQQEISDISRSLKSIARELGVPVIALSQLSREVEKRPNKRPMLSDLRESGAIEQDADVVMFIHRPSYFDNENTVQKEVEESEIIVAKQRNGAIGSLKLGWTPKYTKFMNIDYE